MTLLPMPFGNPSTYKDHSGVDFAQKSGASIRASASGVVLRQGFRPITPTNPRAAGNWLTVLYDGGPPVFMCHLRDRVTCPRNGERFDYGDHLGPVGSTGFSTGPHLHLAIDGQPGYAAVWRYFDAGRVVGDGSGAGAGGIITPTITTDEGDDLMRFLFTRDQGGKGTLWTLLNVTTGETIQTRDQARANSWAQAWGSARTTDVQGLADAVAAVRNTLT